MEGQAAAACLASSLVSLALLAPPQLLWRALRGSLLPCTSTINLRGSRMSPRPAKFTRPASAPHAENGPYTINASLQLVSNPSAWTGFANMIYIDQPINTGLSYSSVSGWSWQWWRGVGEGTHGSALPALLCCPWGGRLPPILV